MSETENSGDNPSLHNLPTSFGVFKPVGWVMLGLPSAGQMRAVMQSLRHAGWPNDELLHFTPSESIDDLQALIDDASPMAGFGYEITMLRRYLALARQGTQWLLVKAKDSDHAAAAAERAAAEGATLAVHYRTLTVEDLI